MGNWKYFQLIATFYRGLFKLIAQGETGANAVDRVIDDFWFFPEEKHLFSNFIILVHYIDIKLSFEKLIANNLVEKFNVYFAKINWDEFDACLNVEEKEHLQELIDEIKYKINMMS